MNPLRVRRTLVVALLALPLTGCASIDLLQPTSRSQDAGSNSLPSASYLTEDVTYHPAGPLAAAQTTASTQAVKQAENNAIAQTSACISCENGVGQGGSVGDACFVGDCAPGAATCQLLPTVSPVYGVDPQEFLCDGGDADPRARLRRDDSIAGLQAEDTVVHYTTESGDIEFQASNRACVYAPRFASIRKITGAVASGKVVAAVGVDRPQGPTGLGLNLPGLTIRDTTELAYADVTKRIDAMRDRNRGVPVDGIVQPVQAQDVLAILAGLQVQDLHLMRDQDLALLQDGVQAAVAWTTDLSVEVAIDNFRTPVITQNVSAEGLTVYDFPDAGRLRVVKVADRPHAQPGDEVTFAIRIDNVGDSPVSDVVLTDNLTTRLKYIEDSQESSLKTEFLAEENESQSLRLQWNAKETLDVGDSAVVTFKCLVR
ncbi:MAG: DUF11 domain-containing protein [Planctomycetota bacterium]